MLANRAGWLRWFALHEHLAQPKAQPDKPAKLQGRSMLGRRVGTKRLPALTDDATGGPRQ